MQSTQSNLDYHVAFILVLTFVSFWFHSFHVTITYNYMDSYYGLHCFHWANKGPSPKGEDMKLHKRAYKLRMGWAMLRTGLFGRFAKNVYNTKIVEYVAFRSVVRSKRPDLDKFSVYFEWKSAVDHNSLYHEPDVSFLKFKV